jgi:hypothetical protein
VACGIGVSVACGIGVSVACGSVFRCFGVSVNEERKNRCEAALLFA